MCSLDTIRLGCSNDTVVSKQNTHTNAHQTLGLSEKDNTGKS